MTAVCFSGVTLPGVAEEEPSAETAMDTEPAEPLFEKLPFYRLTLTSQYHGEVYDVQPFAFPEGSRPNPLPRTNETIVVRLVNNPLQEYQIYWSALEKIELFSELVQDEFQVRFKRLVDDVRKLTPDDKRWKALSGRFDLMFDYIRFLEGYRNELNGLDEAHRQFLFEEAVYRIKSENYPTGMARFEQVFKANKDYPGLERAWSSALDIVMESELEEGREDSARRFLALFAAAYPEHETVKKWRDRLENITRELCEKSQNALEALDYIGAHRFCEEAARVSPELLELQRLQERLRREAPRIDVAVSAPLPTAPFSSRTLLPDWAVRRGQRILDRTLCDFVRPTLGGGEYRPFTGNLEADETGLILHWTFPQEKESPRHASLEDAAHTILFFATAPEASDVFTARYPVPLEQVISSIRFSTRERLEIRLHRPLLVPEALFVLPVLPAERFQMPARVSEIGDISDRPEPEITQDHEIMAVGSEGRFTWELKESRLAGLRLSGDFPPDESGRGGPKVVFEHNVIRGEEAVERLRSGKVDMIDRLPPWEIEGFKSDRQFVTGRYAVPSTHFLVPNLRKPLPANRTFRRALLYGLNRMGMLGKLLEKGGEGIVVSAPFIRGRSLGDPLGYAYDTSIAPRPYEPKLAMALSLLAFNQERDRRADWTEQTEIPELVLARPGHETAEYVSLMIRRQWEAIGLRVRIVEYSESEPIDEDEEEIDFWLVDRCIMEPLVDAPKLFGKDGLAGFPSPYMELALEKLRLSADWPEAGRNLQGIHRLCFEETAVLPLWQLTDYYVHRVGIEGVKGEEDLLDLYRNIEDWTILPRRR